MMECKFARYSFLFAAMLVAAATSAQASVEISSKPTHNMSCVGGVCTPTAKNATLNVDDLAGMLSTGDVTVTTRKKGPSITVSASLMWTSAHQLTLDARRDVSIDAPVVVGGRGGVTIITDNNGFSGDWVLGQRASITFQDLSGSLVINGQAYVLVSDVATLAAAITQNPSGHYALADNYDASADGTYTASPVTTTLFGTLAGLGHVIDKLKIKGNGASGVGMFQVLGGSGSTVRDLGITNANVTVIGQDPEQGSGILAGLSLGGAILHCWTTGKLTLKQGVRGYAGGLIGINATWASRIWSSVQIQAPSATAGGIAGLNDFGSESFIELSYFNGSVSGSTAGGIAGEDEGEIVQTYVMGTVSGQKTAGGIVGLFDNEKDNVFAQSYSTALVTVGSGGKLGGAVGDDENLFGGDIVDNVWDLDTSGVSDPSQGAGNKANDAGLTGESDAQLKSALPDGFNPTYWAQSVSINNGYPYLLANPPH